MSERKYIFSEAYKHKLWDRFGPSASGRGSTWSETRAVREELPPLLWQLGVQTLLDAPCGDFHWMREAELPVKRYVGIDIVPAMIEKNQQLYGRNDAYPYREFRVADLCVDPLPTADLILCRDLLIHLSFTDGLAVLRNFRATNSRWLLISTYDRVPVMPDCATGVSGRWVNMRLPPFNFPPPVKLIDERTEIVCDGVPVAQFGKSLGLWELGGLAL